MPKSKQLQPEKEVKVTWKIYPPINPKENDIHVWESMDGRVQIYGGNQLGFKMKFFFAKPSGEIYSIECESTYASFEGALQSLRDEYEKILITD